MQLSILEQNGDAYPCDFYINDAFKIGNVETDSLEDILNSPIYAKFLEQKPDLPDKCKSCEYLNLCHGGCPRNRLWDEATAAVDTDYFCTSYRQIYSHAHQHMEEIAKKVKINWLQQFIQDGLKLPERNEACICGSGKKFKKCCARLKGVPPTL